jgi:hypothetical protein
MLGRSLIVIGLMLQLRQIGAHAMLSSRLIVLSLLAGACVNSSMTKQHSDDEIVSNSNNQVHKSFDRTLPFIKSLKKSPCKKKSVGKASKKACDGSSKSMKGSSKSKRVECHHVGVSLRM